MSVKVEGGWLDAGVVWLDDVGELKRDEADGRERRVAVDGCEESRGIVGGDGVKGSEGD